jgi:hypothetical protein
MCAKAQLVVGSGMDGSTIGLLSGAAFIVGLAVTAALTDAARARAQEWAKWFMAVIGVGSGASIMLEDGDPPILILAVLIVGAWLGRRLVTARRRRRPRVQRRHDYRS